jgi:RNA polymerase sigma factor (sigma-70 family)
MRRRAYQVLPWPEPAPEIAAESDAQPERHVEQNEWRSGIMAAIQMLDDKHRLVVILRYYLGLSNDEIAQTLRLPSGTVRSRLHTARQRLKCILEAREEREGGLGLSKRATP